MPEIRKDYATDTWVVFSAARSRRPGAFRNAKASTPKEECPFCVGHETLTPPEVLAYRDRYRALAADPRVRYVLIFKNHGERAGASLSHPHSQLVATPIVPLRILDELEGVRSHRGSKAGSCLYCDVVSEERKARHRIVAEDERFVALAPYAARIPFATWVLPNDSAGAFESIPTAPRLVPAAFLR